MMRYVIMKDDAPGWQILNQHAGWGRVYEDAGWILLHVHNPTLIKIARQNPAQAIVLSSIYRSAKHIPQRFIDFLQARAIAVAADDTIFDLLVKLVGDEDAILGGNF